MRVTDNPNQVKQIIQSFNNQMWTRVHQYDDVWTPWVRCDNFGCDSLSSLASALGANGVMQTLVNHTGNSAYTFSGNTRYVYILEDNFSNLYRAYFIVSSDNIVVICNGLPSYFSFNGESPKRVHVSQTNSGGAITVAITVNQETSYNLYALKLII